MYEPLVPGEISAVTSTPKANTPPPAAPTHLRTGPAASGPTANATGGADALIEAAAPPSGMVASVEARLRADEALALAGPEGIIDELEGSRLDDAVRSLGGIINATHGRMVLSVCRVLDTGWWKGGGVLSARQWLAIHWATNTATISRVIAVAKKAETYPEVVDALVAGMISLEAAHLICGRIPSEYQTTYVAYAIHMTFDQLRTCTHAVRPPPNSGRNKQADKAGEDDASGDDKAGQTTADEPTSANPPPRLGFTQRDDGRWSLNANLSPEDGALIETALQEARDRAFKAAEDPDERLRLTWADALVDVARRALDHADADTAGGQPTDRTLVHYHYELGHLYTEGSTQPLPDALRRQILCDTNLVGIGFRDGRPVDVGRRTRVISRRLRRLILRRDRCCVIPGCGATRGLEIHHLIHWEDGGRTDAGNLAALCKAHHRAHHHGLVHITGDPHSGLGFTNADGTPLCARPAKAPSSTDTDALVDTARNAGMGDPATHRFGATGERLQRWSIIPGPSPVPARPPDLSPILGGIPNHSDDGATPTGTSTADSATQPAAESRRPHDLPRPWWVLDPPTFDTRPLILRE